MQMAEDEIAKAEDRLLEQMVASEEYDRRIKAADQRLKEVEESVRGSAPQSKPKKQRPKKIWRDRGRTRALSRKFRKICSIITSASRKNTAASRWPKCDDEKCCALRHANPPARVSRDAQREQRGYVSLRDVHPHSLLHRAHCGPPLDDHKPQTSGASRPPLPPVKISAGILIACHTLGSACRR